jgi:hypothetical protein
MDGYKRHYNESIYTDSMVTLFQDLRNKGFWLDPMVLWAKIGLFSVLKGNTFFDVCDTTVYIHM